MNDNPQTPEEVGAWLASHGGPAGGEGPDANGRITQRAADGSYIVQQMQPGGTSRVIEVRAAAPGDPSAVPAPTAPRGAGMNQQELEALLGQRGPFGANDFREETKTEEIPNPKYDGSDITVPPTIKAPVTYRTWVKPGTNIRLTFKVNADGTYTKTYDGPDDKENPPARPVGAGDWHTEGTPDPSKPGGFDNSRPIMVNSKTGERRQPSEEELTKWRANNQPKREEVPVTTHPGYTQVTVVDPTTNTTERYYIGPDGNRVNALPPAPTAAKPEKDGNGNWGYWDTKPGQPPRWVPIQGSTPAGESPKPVEVNGVWGVWKPGAKPGDPPTFQASPNQPTGAVTSPVSLPSIVVGHVAQSYQAYADALARDPTLTPTQRATLLAQAKEVAGLAIQEAGIKQREAESNLNAQVNLATTRLTAEQNAMTNALKVASDINDKLPPGSDLGGQAFAAMLGMSLITAHRSGIYDIKPPGMPVTDASSRPAPPTITNPGDRASVEAQRQQTQAQLQQAQQPPPAPAPIAPGATPPPPGARTGSPSAMDVAQQQQAAAAAAAAAAAPLPRDAQGNAPQDAPLDIVNRTTGERRRRPLAQINAMPDRDDWGIIDPNTGQVLPNLAPSPTVAPVAPPAATPQYGKPGADPSLPAVAEPHPGGRVLPQPMTSPGGDVQMAPPAPDFAALAPYKPPAPSAAPAPAMPDLGVSPAMLQARAAATPPWRLSEQDIAAMQAAGVPDEVIFAVPGMPAGRMA